MWNKLIRIKNDGELWNSYAVVSKGCQVLAGNEGEWLAFMSEIIPPELDVIIKGNHLAAFGEAAMKVDEDDVFRMIDWSGPMQLPMIRTPMRLPRSRHGTVIQGEAKYPIDPSWVPDPVMSVKTWAKFCMLVCINAEQDRDQLEPVMTVCCDFVPMEERLPEMYIDC